MSVMQHDEKRLHRAAAAGMIGVSTSTLERWHRNGQGPKFIKIGARVFYRLCDVEQWLAAQERASGQPAQASAA